MTTNELILTEAELHEIEAAESEMNLYIKDEVIGLWNSRSV